MEYCVLLKWLPVIKDVVFTIAAFTTMSIAVYGINKWRAEHKGKINIDAAKALLVSVYNVRNNFELVRSPWLDASEFPKDYSSTHPADRTDLDKANGRWYVYKNRLEPLIKAMNELDTALIEGEVVWGSEVKAQGKMLNNSFNKLVFSIKELVYEEQQGIENPHDEMIMTYRKDIAASKGSEDELSKQIETSVKYFEKLLAPYVRAKNN